MALPNNLVLRAFTYAVVLTSLFVLTIGAVLISLVVGDWIILKTSNETLAWFVGVFIMLGFLLTLGGGIGFWLWMRGPTSDHPLADAPTKQDNMERLLQDMSVIERD